MTRLQHLIRAAGTIADDDDIVVIGSQAVPGQFPAVPAELLVSREADVYPRAHPERADLIDGSIGEGSPFEREPVGWQDRLVVVSGPNTRLVRGWCLEVHDLAIAKLVAGREKDLDFAASVHRHGMARLEMLSERLAVTRLEAPIRALVAARIVRYFGGL